MSHAPGLSGIPCSGHFSRAASRLSWTTSSAISKLPMIRTMAPVSFAASSRKTAASAASVAVRVSVRPSSFHSRPHFDGPSRPSLGHLEGLVEVCDLDDGEATDDLLRLDERTVGDDRPAVLESNRGGGRRAFKLLAAKDLARSAVLIEPFLGCLDPGLQVLLRQVLEPLLVFHRPDEQQHVFHSTPPALTTNGRT